jgi:hypothetical protein
MEESALWEESAALEGVVVKELAAPWVLVDSFCSSWPWGR